MVASLCCCYLLRPPHILLVLLSLLLVTTSAQAGSINRTIDDEHGDSVTGARPTFSPAGGWKQGGTCQDCLVKLDATQTFQRTWHDATHHPRDTEPRMITAQFTGTAVYVYCIVPDKVPGADTLTNLTFSIDGQQVGSYTHVPTDSTAFSYNVPVYINRNLPNKAHTIVIQSVGDAKASLVLFDNIVYTFTEEDIPTPTPNPTAPSTLSPGPLSFSPPTARLDSLASFAQAPSTSSSSTKLTSIQLSPTETHSTADTRSSSTSSDAQAQTADADASITHSDNNEFPLAVVVGGAVGGFVIIAILVALLLYLRRRRRRPEIVFTDPFADRRLGGRPTQIPAPTMLRRGSSKVALLHSGSFSTASYANSPRPSATTYANSPRPSLTPYMISPRPSIATYANSPRPSVTTYPNSPRPSVTSSEFLTMAPSATNTTHVSQPYTGMRIDVGSIHSPPSTGRIRGQPDVPSSPSASSPLSMIAETQYTAMSLPSMHVHVSDEKSTLGPPSVTDTLAPASSSRAAARVLPVPPTRQASSSGAPVSRTGKVSDLRSQVAELQEEVMRLREEQKMQRALEQQEMRRLVEEAPPRYDA